MRPHRARILATLLALAPATSLHAQATAQHAAAWRADPPRIAAVDGRAATGGHRTRFTAGDTARTKTHPVTGLAIGAGAGLAAAGLLLSGFCSGGDDICSSSDKGRLLFITVVPAAALGALIGSLIHTHR